MTTYSREKPQTNGASLQSDTDMDKRLHELQERLRRCQRRQRAVEESKQEVDRLRTNLIHHRNELEQERQASRADLLSLRLRHRACEMELQRSVHWNIVNDCFHIWWHPQGAAFATINGIRLGAEGPPPIGDKMKLMDSTTHHSQDFAASSSASTTSTIATAVSPKANLMFSDDASVMTMATTTSVITASMDIPRRYLGFGSQTTHNNSTPSMPLSSASVMDSSMSTSSKPLPSPPTNNTTTALETTPWRDINSALGQVCLLLSVVEQNPHAGISYPNHVLFPCGSTSKIGFITKSNGMILSSPTTHTAMYQLYYSEDISFPLLFGKRSSFNSGLQALCECLANAAATIHKRDRTITVPYPMMNTSKNPPNPQWKIGGIPVQYNADQGLAWTRVMKYLLTNCKWVVAYVAKHVDR